MILVTNEYVPVDRSGVTGGRGYRLFHLVAGLRAAGAEVEIAYRNLPPEAAARGPGETARGFSSTEAVNGYLTAASPDFVLFSPWDLINGIEEQTARLGLDLTGSMLLEHSADPGESRPQYFAQKAAAFAAADFYLVPNERQELFYRSLFLQAGNDSPGARVVRFPIALADEENEPAEATGEPALIAGGVFWPWNDNRALLRTACAALRRVDRGKLIILSGRYYGQAVDGSGFFPAELAADADLITVHPYLSLADYDRVLRQGGVGFEVYPRSWERELAVTVRSISLLRAGAPLLISEFMELAGQVRDYGAGWVVADGDDLGELVVRALRDPAAIRERGAGARKLFREKYAVDGYCGRLLAFLRELPKKGRSDNFFRRFDDLIRITARQSRTIDYLTFKLEEKARVFSDQVAEQAQRLTELDGQVRELGAARSELARELARITGRRSFQMLLAVKKMLNVILGRRF